MLFPKEQVLLEKATGGRCCCSSSSWSWSPSSSSSSSSSLRTPNVCPTWRPVCPSSLPRPCWSTFTSCSNCQPSPGWGFQSGVLLVSGAAVLLLFSPLDYQAGFTPTVDEWLHQNTLRSLNIWVLPFTSLHSHFFTSHCFQLFFKLYLAQALYKFVGFFLRKFLTFRFVRNLFNLFLILKTFSADFLFHFFVKYLDKILNSQSPLNFF